ncbi:MAG: hypothetical protein RSA29_13590 [Clostridium sp.]|uniref:hypothetical protein n=1 Tax=Clostridium sp. TaxID=1506 RepID=UPI00303E1EDB
MKKVWNNPEVQNLGLGNTMTLDCLTRDPGHNMPGPHLHHCDDCSKKFENWQQAIEHAQNNKRPDGTGHHVSCDLIS